MLSPPDPPSRTYGGKLAAPERWDAFTPRVGDIVVSTSPKSGTTWVQTILALLISGDPLVAPDIDRNAPWLDIAMPELAEVLARLEGQSQRRQVKTYTPLERGGRENLLRLYYADMRRDLPAAVRRIADHVGIAHPRELEVELVQAATVANMKAKAPARWRRGRRSPCAVPARTGRSCV